MIEEGSKVWVRIDPKKDEWTPGRIKQVLGNQRVCVLETQEEVTVPFDRVSRWGNQRIRTLELVDGIFIQNLVESRSFFERWLGQIEVKLEVSIPRRRYSTKERRLSMIAGLLPRDVIPERSLLIELGILGVGMPSWLEMALIGDGLWTSYLRIILINKGYRNGKTAARIQSAGMETRRRLQKVGDKLELRSLLPFVREKLHSGELVEAFLGWTYTFVGEKASRQLAEKFLAAMGKNTTKLLA